MTSDSENNKAIEDKEALEEIVYSLLRGDITIDELKKKLVDCDNCPDSLEDIIQDCLKNRVERKCCPDKVINDLKQKIGYTTVLMFSIMINFETLIYF